MTHTPSVSSTKPSQGRYWSQEEHQRFVEAINRFGIKDVKAISAHVGTRNSTQVRTHAQKYFLRIEREKKKYDEPKKEGKIKVEGSNSNDNNENVSAPNNGRQSPLDDMLPFSSTTPVESSIISTTSSVPIATVCTNSPESNTPNKKSKSKKKSNKRKLPPISDSIKPSPKGGVKPSVSIKSEPNFASKQAGIMSVAQQLAAETMATVLPLLNGWTALDYINFLEGLITLQEEKDVNTKLKLISEEYLPRFPLEEIKQCYVLLTNAAKKENEDDQFGKRLKPNVTTNLSLGTSIHVFPPPNGEGVSGLNSIRYNTTASTPSPTPSSSNFYSETRYPLLAIPFGTNAFRPSDYYPNQQNPNFSPSFEALEAAMFRRAANNSSNSSTNFDPFSQNREVNNGNTRRIATELPADYDLATLQFATIVPPPLEEEEEEEDEFCRPTQKESTTQNSP